MSLNQKFCIGSRLEAHERKLMCTALRWVALSHSNCQPSNTAAILMLSFHTMAINVFLKTSPIYDTEEKPYFQDFPGSSVSPSSPPSFKSGRIRLERFLGQLVLPLSLPSILLPLSPPLQCLGKKWTNLFLWVPSAHLEKEHYSINPPGLML